MPYFHGIEVPFLQNLSALFGQCPLTFEVLPRPLQIILLFYQFVNSRADGLKSLHVISALNINHSNFWPKLKGSQTDLRQVQFIRTVP